VRLPDLKIVEFRDESVAGEFAVDGAATALSTSRRKLALISRGEVFLFDLALDLKVTLSARFAVPALVNAARRAEIGARAFPAFVDENRLAISRPDGLVLLVDLRTRDEIWRFRIPNAQASSSSDSRVQLVVADDASWLAVHGDQFAAILDASEGLPLSRPVRSHSRGETGRASEPLTDKCREAYFVGHCFSRSPERASTTDPSLSTSECLRRFPLRRCFDRAELSTIFDRANRQIGTWLMKSPDGTLVAETLPEDWHVLLHPVQSQPAATRDSQLHVIRCRSGWLVNEMRLTRFDVLESLTEGGLLAIDMIGRNCKG
jgi:hypothetical protein